VHAAWARVLQPVQTRSAGSETRGGLVQTLHTLDVCQKNIKKSDEWVDMNDKRQKTRQGAGTNPGMQRKGARELCEVWSISWSTYGEMGLNHLERARRKLYKQKIIN
jgi:hypothetical protein